MKYQRIGKGGSSVKGKKAAGIFFTDGESVLLLKRDESGQNPGTWALPGGKTEEGETAIGTAIRETKEETGLDSIPGYRFDELESKDGQRLFTTFLYHIAEQFDVNLSQEHTDWEWVRFENLKDKKLHPKFEDSLPRFLRSANKKAKTFSEWVEIRQVLP